MSAVVAEWVTAGFRYRVTRRGAMVIAELSDRSDAMDDPVWRSPGTDAWTADILRVALTMVLDGAEIELPGGEADPSQVPDAPGWWWGRLHERSAWVPWEIVEVGGQLCFAWPEADEEPVWLAESWWADVHRMSEWGGPCTRGAGAQRNSGGVYGTHLVLPPDWELDATFAGEWRVHSPSHEITGPDAEALARSAWQHWARGAGSGETRDESTGLARRVADLESRVAALEAAR